MNLEEKIARLVEKNEYRDVRVHKIMLTVLEAIEAKKKVSSPEWCYVLWDDIRKLLKGGNLMDKIKRPEKKKCLTLSERILDVVTCKDRYQQLCCECYRNQTIDQMQAWHNSVKLTEEELSKEVYIAISGLNFKANKGICDKVAKAIIDARERKEEGEDK